MATIFLSAARADREIANRVWKKLSETFTISREDVLVPSEYGADPWESQRLQSELDIADFIVVLWSSNSARSQWVKREIERAIDAWSQGTLILVKLDQTPLPPGLRDLQALDLSTIIHSQTTAALDQLSSAVQRALIYRRSTQLASWSTSRSRPPLPSAAARDDMRIAAAFWMVVFILMLSFAVLLEWRHLIIVGATALLIVGLWMTARRVKALLTERAARRAAKAPPPQALATNDQIFVSFSTKDRPIVDQLVGAIKGEGLSPWIYTGGEVDASRYARRIVQAIKASRKVAVMCSNNSFQSDEVVREIYLAGSARKPFVAFFLDREPAPDGLPADFEYFLTGFPFVPVKGRDDQALRADIRRFLSA